MKEFPRRWLRAGAFLSRVAITIAAYASFTIAVLYGLFVIARAVLWLWIFLLAFRFAEPYPAQHFSSGECRTESPPGELVDPRRDPCH